MVGVDWCAVVKGTMDVVVAALALLVLAPLMLLIVPRRTRLDEFPQVWHVLRGDRASWGRWPEAPAVVARWEREYDEILRVRPAHTR